MPLTVFFFDLDDLPTLEFTVLRRDGTVYDLTGAAVDLLVEGVGEFTCNVTSATAGECERIVEVGDFPVANRYRCQLRVSGGGAVFHTDIFVAQVSASINTTAVGPVPPSVFPFEGGVLFGTAAGAIGQDLTNFFWDDTGNNLRLFGGTVGASGAKVLTLGQGTAPAAATDSAQIWVADFLGAAGRTGFHFIDETGALVRFGSAAANFTNIDLVNGTVTIRFTADGGNLTGEFGTHSNHPFGFLTNNVTRGQVDTEGAIRWFVGTTPSASVTDVAKLFTIDRSGAGTARLHYRSEDDTANIPITGGIAFKHIQFVRKTTNETVNNSSTLQDDDHLLFAVAANERVHFELILRLVTNTTADFKLDFTVPSGSGVFVPMSSGRWDPAAAAWTQTEQSSMTVAMTFSGSAGNSQNIHLRGLFTNGATPGNVVTRWAQNTANASNTVVEADSILLIWRGL